MTKKVVIVLSVFLIFLVTVGCTPSEIEAEVQNDPALEIDPGVGIQVVEGETYDYQENIGVTVTESNSWCLEAQVNTGEGLITSHIHPNMIDDIDIVSSVFPVDGALTIANQPNTASHLQVKLTDADASIGPMAVTITGADEHGLIQTITETFGWGGTESLTTEEQFSSITSVTLAGTAGATGADSILITIGEVSINEMFCHTHTILTDGRYSHSYRNQDQSITELRIYLANGDLEGKTVQNSSGKFIYDGDGNLMFSVLE